MEFFDVLVRELENYGDEGKEYEEEEEGLTGKRLPFVLYLAEGGHLLVVFAAYFLAFPDDHLAFPHGCARFRHDVVRARPYRPRRYVAHLVSLHEDGDLYVGYCGQGEGKDANNEVFLECEARGRFVLFVLHALLLSAAALFS